MEWLRVDDLAPEAAALERAAAILRAGGLVVYPTDTLYGLAVDPRLPHAVERVFEVKGRPGRQALPLIVASLGQAEEVAVLSDIARRLAGTFWPGPLTLLAEARPGLARGVAGADGSVALRVADHAVARGLAFTLGFALTSTSANPSGGEARQSAVEAAAELGGKVDLVLDGGPTRGGLPSTIVDARGEPPRLIRTGAVPFHLVLQAMTLR